MMVVLGPLLEGEGYQLTYASSKNSKVVRLLDMMTQVFQNASRVDVVLIDTYSTQNFYYAFVVSQLCRVLRLPYVPILHGGKLPHRLIKCPRMSALIFKHSLYNVSPSNYLKEQFEKMGYTNLRYIPNTIELKRYSFKRERDSASIRLLWVRSFSKIYNPFLAVNVLKSLRDSGYDASLCMVGPDADGTLQKVKDLTLELETDVRFTGKLTKLEWIELSKDYNVFINTTNIDNTPVSVIEAMALGLPVVSTNVGGMPYLIENNVNGILVEKNNVDEMTQAIMMLLNNTQKRTQIIQNARELSESFDWQRVRLKWLALLNTN